MTVDVRAYLILARLFFMLMNSKILKSAFLSINQRPISYYPIYTKITGSVTGGVLLSQLLYWYAAVNGRKFYKRDAEIKKETYLTTNELRSAKKKLKALQFIFVTREGVPAKTYYDFDIELLFETIVSFSEIHDSSLVKSTKQDSLNPTNSSSEINETITENTQETTTENTVLSKSKIYDRGLLHQSMILLFDEQHEQLFGEKLTKWIAKEVTSIKHLRIWFTDRAAKQLKIEKKSEITNDEILKRFKSFLEIAATANNGYYKRVFTPCSLYGQAQNILNAYKALNSAKKTNTKKRDEIIKGGYDKFGRPIKK